MNNECVTIVPHQNRNVTIGNFSACIIWRYETNEAADTLLNR